MPSSHTLIPDLSVYIGRGGGVATGAFKQNSEVIVGKMPCTASDTQTRFCNWAIRFIEGN